MTYLGIVFFIFLVLWVYWGSWIFGSIISIMFGNVPAIISIFFFLSNPSPLKVYSYIYGSVLEADLQITDALFISLKFFLSNFILHSFYCYILTVLNIFICNIWYDIYTIQNFLPQILWFLHFKVWFFYFLIYFFIFKFFFNFYWSLFEEAWFWSF